MSGSARPGAPGVPRWRRRLVVAFVGLYLFVQVSVPVLGLRARAEGHEAFPFSWHMFSTLVGVADPAAEGEPTPEVRGWPEVGALRRAQGERGR